MDSKQLFNYLAFENELEFSAHAAYRLRQPLSSVLDYDKADDGPECEIITRILARHFTYSPGVEKLVLEWTR